MNEFTIHGCEQVLRFSSTDSWNDLPEEIKIQLGFNMGVMSLGLNLSKEEGYLSLVELREGTISMQEFHKRMNLLISDKKVPVREENINKPFDTIKQ